MIAPLMTEASPITTCAELIRRLGNADRVAPALILRDGRMDHLECVSGSAFNSWEGWRNVLSVQRFLPFATVFPLFAMKTDEVPLALLEQATLLGGVLME